MEIFRPILIGLLATLVALLPRTLHEIFPNLSPPSAWLLMSSALALLILAWLQRRSQLRGRAQDLPGEGVADLVRYLHTPGQRPAPVIAFARAASSLGLSVFGWGAGSEGAAIETTRAVQSISRRGRSLWSDPHRRTEVSLAVTAGVAAAFASPWAGVAMVAELSLGGRLSSILLTAASAAFFGKWLPGLGWLSGVEIDPGGGIFGFSVESLRSWVSVIAIGAGAGVGGALAIRFMRAAKEHLRALVRGDLLAITCLGFLGIGAVIAFGLGGGDFSARLENLLWLRTEESSLAYLILAQLLCLGFLHAGFGTVGILAPVFLLGALLGAWIDQIGIHAYPGALSISPLVGGAALFAVVFSCPITGVFLAWGIGGNATLVVPTLLAATLAQGIRRALRTGSLIDEDLIDRGIQLVRGRSLVIMQRLRVKDAMARDFLSFFEHERISDLRPKVLASPYAFFPVMGTQSRYLGLLSLDLLEEVWETAMQPGENPHLDRLLEAKDLLYRAGGKAPAVLASDSLATADALLEDHPCVAVIDENSQIMGLLFAHQIRLIYEREANRERFAVAGPHLGEASVNSYK